MPFTFSSPSPSPPTTSPASTPPSPSSDTSSSSDIFFDTHFSTLFGDETRPELTSSSTASTSRAATDIPLEDECCGPKGSKCRQKAMSKRKRERGKDQKSKDGDSCVLSDLINPITMSPPIMHEEKKKRRKRARTEEEKKQRALERKMKNRQSAMRSRQRVLNELKKDKEAISTLKAENEQQKEQIRNLQKELEEAKRQIQALEQTQVPALVPSQSFSFEEGTHAPDESAMYDFLDALTSNNNNVSSFNNMTNIDIPANAFQRLNSFNLDFDGSANFDSMLLGLKTKTVPARNSYDEYSPESGCDSESQYNETASFGRTSRCQLKAANISFAAAASKSCAYKFSWLSEIWRLKKQLTEAGLCPLGISKICKSVLRNSII